MTYGSPEDELFRKREHTDRSSWRGEGGFEDRLLKASAQNHAGENPFFLCVLIGFSRKLPRYLYPANSNKSRPPYFAATPAGSCAAPSVLLQ